MRETWWEAAIGSALAALVALVALGALFNIHAFSSLGGLLLWATVAAVLIPAFVRGVGDFRGYSGWPRLGGLVPFAGVALIAAVPLWWSAFRHRHASFWWLAVIAGGFAALIALRRSAEIRWQEQRRDEFVKMPEAEKTSGASNPSDLGKWV